MGTTSANLSCSGKTPFDMVRFIICVSGFLMFSIAIDKTLFDIPTGPGDLCLFSLSTVSVTNVSVKGVNLKLCFWEFFR